jgi:orotate phosphoribosyltransferase
MENEGRIERLAKFIIKTGALKFGVFELSSGAISPYYIDLRLIPGEPSAFISAVDMLEGSINGIGKGQFERVGGVPTAGISYAAALSYKLRKPLIYVRKEAKSHGTQKMVEGLLLPGDRVVLVDDLVTTGHSLIEAARAIRLEGGIVEHAVVLVDRLEEGAQRLMEHNIQLHALATIRQIIDKLRELDAIEEDEYESIVERISKAH